jgi:outer membrane protein assembly factor BamD (BamD/ComL family)
MLGMHHTRRMTGFVCALLCGLTACGPYAEVASGPPDKVLFDRAMDAVRQNRFDVAHLTLETLVNTYPDSSYAQEAEVVLQDSRIANCGELWSASSECDRILEEPEWPK